MNNAFWEREILKGDWCENAWTANKTPYTVKT